MSTRQYSHDGLRGGVLTRSPCIYAAEGGLWGIGGYLAEVRKLLHGADNKEIEGTTAKEWFENAVNEQFLHYVHPDTQTQRHAQLAGCNFVTGFEALSSGMSTNVAFADQETKEEVVNLMLKPVCKSDAPAPEPYQVFLELNFHRPEKGANSLMMFAETFHVAAWVALKSDTGANIVFGGQGWLRTLFLVFQRFVWQLLCGLFVVWCSSCVRQLFFIYHLFGLSFVLPPIIRICFVQQFDRSLHSRFAWFGVLFGVSSVLIIPPLFGSGSFFQWNCVRWLV